MNAAREMKDLKLIESRLEKLEDIYVDLIKKSDIFLDKLKELCQATSK